MNSRFTLNFFILIPALVFLLHCTTKKPVAEKSTTIPLEATTTKVPLAQPATDQLPIDTTSAETDAEGEPEPAFDYSACTRGAAEPVIKKNVYPQASFHLNDDHHTGTETVALPSGDLLTIKHWGCEYYVLTFRFETSRFQADTTQTLYWLDKACTLMEETTPALEAPRTIEDGTLFIRNYLKDASGYALQEELVFYDDMIRDFATLDKIEQLAEERFAVEITFATGPL